MYNTGIKHIKMLEGREVSIEMLTGVNKTATIQHTLEDGSLLIKDSFGFVSIPKTSNLMINLGK